VCVKEREGLASQDEGLSYATLVYESSLVW
jgi:hypothetical protein